MYQFPYLPCVILHNGMQFEEHLNISRVT